MLNGVIYLIMNCMMCIIICDGFLKIGMWYFFIDLICRISVFIVLYLKSCDIY